MKIFHAVAVLALIGCVRCQTMTPVTEKTTTTDYPPTTTDSPTTSTSSTTAPTTTTSTTAPPTTTTSTTAVPTTSTTAVPTTSTTAVPTTSTTVVPTTPKPHPKPTEPTLGNYTLFDGEEVCFMALMKVTVLQNATHFPLINGSLSVRDSSCASDSITAWINFANNQSLQLKIKHDNESFFVNEISVRVGANITGDRTDLVQFAVPLKQYYKCATLSDVNLVENDLRIQFSEMKYQAFQKEKKADFVGGELVCSNDSHSDVFIIAIGCALTLLILVILVAYLVARRRNGQQRRGYQSF